MSARRDEIAFFNQESKVYAETGHDTRCENLPGGKYAGRTIGTKATPIPCHCSARAQGRDEAKRKLRNGR